MMLSVTSNPYDQHTNKSNKLKPPSKPEVYQFPSTHVPRLAWHNTMPLLTRPSSIGIVYVT